MSGPVRVLLLDDNPDDRELVRYQLLTEFPDADPVEILDGGALAAALAAAEPCLVVTDLDLRWMSGLDVLKHVKQRFHDCPVIMFTGTGDEVIAVDAMKAGLDDYVVKSARQLPRLRASMRQVLDAADRKRALRQREEQLQAALAHKELLLKELHHRVKNNIQTMTSLLWLRSRAATNPDVRAELEDIGERIQVLGQVQAHIYETEELDRVAFEAVLEEVASSLLGAHGGTRMRLDCRLNGGTGDGGLDNGGLELPVQRAMPLALLVSEVILNAIKHGLRDREEGVLTLRIVAEEGRRAILVQDDGRGFDAANVQPGTGSRLVEALAREAAATIEFLSQNSGTAVRIWVN